MDEEMDSLHKNSTWELVNLPKGKKANKCKWVFAKKDIPFLQEEVRYKTRLVVKDYTQKEWID